MLLRIKLVEHFKELVPENLHFDVGYFEGQQHCKIWLASNEDFALMYRKHPKGEITLWCDGRKDEDDDNIGKKKRKRDGDKSSSRRQEREDEVDDIFKQLKEKHEKKYDIPKLRLWARSICGNLHDDLDTPPDLPAFREHTARKAPRESLTDALTGAAVTLTKMFKGDNVEKSALVPPELKIDLRMKSFGQLRYLQQLLDDGILTATEYTEQKENILSSLRNLN